MSQLTLTAINWTYFYDTVLSKVAPKSVKFTSILIILWSSLKKVVYICFIVNKSALERIVGFLVNVLKFFSKYWSWSYASSSMLLRSFIFSAHMLIVNYLRLYDQRLSRYLYIKKLITLNAKKIIRCICQNVFCSQLVWQHLCLFSDIANIFWNGIPRFILHDEL